MSESKEELFRQYQQYCIGCSNHDCSGATANICFKKKLELLSRLVGKGIAYCPLCHRVHTREKLGICEVTCDGCRKLRGELD